MTRVKTTPMPFAVLFFFEVPKKTQSPRYLVKTKLLIKRAEMRMPKRYPKYDLLTVKVVFSIPARPLATTTWVIAVLSLSLKESVTLLPPAASTAEATSSWISGSGSSNTV
ncbi:MAG: hypothetical protein ACD_75C01775G0002 [uncultured bacterium]|nr:MAG: hypothetical protein ACD_75C01775G0002 [uncultured bacterium]